MKFTNLLFDLDGTLTDPALGITRCYHYALAFIRDTRAEVAALAAEGRVRARRLTRPKTRSRTTPLAR